MSKRGKGFEKHCFEMLMRAQVVNMEAVMEAFKCLVGSSEYSKADNLKKLTTGPNS